MAIITREEDIELLRESGKILADTMKELVERVREGVSAAELNIFAEKYNHDLGARP